MVRNGQVFHKEYKNAAVLGTTEPTEIWYVSISDNDIQNWGYFNKLRVVNASDVPIAVRFNHNTDTTLQYAIAAGTMSIWDLTDNIKFDNIALVNLSAVTDVAIEELTVDVMKVI